MVSQRTRSMLGPAIAGLALMLLPDAVHAASPKVGDVAPPVSATTWLNVKPDETPTAERLRGKVVMIEFWGTWCSPCVRAMPSVQALWDRYRERGLFVAAISYEEPDVLRVFLDKNSYSLPVGSDPTKACIEAYGVSGWPYTIVIGKDGKIAYAGAPYGVEAAIENALGLDASPGSLLTEYFTALGAGGVPNVRASLERLAEKAPPDFDLKSWAEGAGGVAPASPPVKLDGAKVLGDVAKAASPPQDTAKQQAALDALAGAAPTVFDLAAWTRDVFGRDFAITAKEFKQLLEDKKFDLAVDAVLDRKPSAEVVGLATKSIPLAVHCTQKAAETRSFARKAVMARLYPFADRLPRNNEGFWAELNTSGAASSPDKMHVVALLIGGELVRNTAVESYIDRQYARAFIMDALKDGKKPALSKLRGAVDADVADATKQIKTKYDH